MRPARTVTESLVNRENTRAHRRRVRLEQSPVLAMLDLEEALEGRGAVHRTGQTKGVKIADQQRTKLKSAKTENFLKKNET